MDNPEQLLASGRSYWSSRVLLTAAELDLFTDLARSPMTAAQVTARIDGDERAVTILLDAMAALGWLLKREGRYVCPPAVARWLSAQSSESILPMLRHQARLWPSWSELTGIVRKDPGAWRRAHAPRDAEGTSAFIGAMQAVGGPAAAGIIAAIEPARSRRLLDVGGGPGAHTRAFLRAVPEGHATLFDLPDVVELARGYFGDAGLLARTTFVAGDFERDELPPGHDLALLSAIIHQNSRAQNVALYGKAHRALVPGGRVVIRDHIMSADRTQPAAGALFAVNMLVRTEGGNVYTFDEIRADLEAAGFERVRQLQTGDVMNGLVEAHRA